MNKPDCFTEGCTNRAEPCSAFCSECRDEWEAMQEHGAGVFSLDFEPGVLAFVFGVMLTGWGQALVLPRSDAPLVILAGFMLAAAGGVLVQKEARRRAAK